MNSAQRLARIGGVLYLLVAIFGAFAWEIVYARMYAPGSSAITAGNVIANSGLVRAGVVADLFQATVFAFLGMTMYQLLKHVNKSAAAAMVVLVAIATAIICLNAVFELEGLRVATNHAYVTALGAAGSAALVLTLLDIQHYGVLVAQIFFGLWLVPLGYLVYKSGWFPKALGVTLIIGAACYILDMLVQLILPDLGAKAGTFIVLPSAIAEFWMLGYLLVFGVRSAPPAERALIDRPGRPSIEAFTS
ncbi:MAG TPA: DUF4386 domain-containing protein [Candidatus Dormibacteraeota bacterium]